MMIFKNSKTPKTYKSLICLFEKDLHRFEPATQLTISAQLSETKNVTEADVSQKFMDRSALTVENIFVFFLKMLPIFQFYESMFLGKRYQTLQRAHIVDHQETDNPPNYPLVFNAKTKSRKISNYSKINF